MTFLEQIFASLERSGDAVVLQEMRDGQAVPLRKCFYGRGRAGGESGGDGCRRRYRGDHLHLGYLWRGEGRDAERGQRRIHAGSHLGATGSADERRPGGGRRVSLPAALLCGFVDHDADLPAARQQADIEYRSGKDCHGDAVGGPGLFTECSRASRTHAQSCRRAALEDRWISVKGVHHGKGRVGAAAGGEIARRGWVLAQPGESARVSYHSKNDAWRQTRGADFWVGAAECGNPTVF